MKFSSPQGQEAILIPVLEWLCGRPASYPMVTGDYFQLVPWLTFEARAHLDYPTHVQGVGQLGRFTFTHKYMWAK
jgi:hypothetical protein